MHGGEKLQARTQTNKAGIIHQAIANTTSMLISRGHGQSGCGTVNTDCMCSVKHGPRLPNDHAADSPHRISLTKPKDMIVPPKRLYIKAEW